MRAGEWAEQDSVWLCYPSHRDHWGDDLTTIRAFFRRLICLVSSYQRVDILFNSLEDENEFFELTKELGPHKVVSHQIRHNDIWIRDYGPLFVQDRAKLKIAKFKFNAWGGKFPPYDLDDHVPFAIADYLGVELCAYDLTLEGGALEFNGEGLALSTKPCLLGETRNPGQNLDAIHHEIAQALELQNVISLEEGLVGDHTDGHIDNVARFINPTTLLIASAEQGDPQYEVCLNIKREIEALQSSWPELKVHEVCLPKAKQHQNEWMSRSYLNFIFLNGAIIVPTFGESSDEKALSLFKSFFPDRDVLGFDCRELIVEGGGLHCMSCHQPRVQL